MKSLRTLTHLACWCLLASVAVGADGPGFGVADGKTRAGRVGLGFVRIEGSSDDWRGFNVWGGRKPENPAQFDGKSWGTISVNGVLYSWIVPDVPDTSYFLRPQNKSVTQSNFGRKIHNPGLKRYLLCTEHTKSHGSLLGIFDAPQPWGPWTTAFFTAEWDVGPGETVSFPTKWISCDGRTLHLAFSGDDYFSVRQAKIIVHDKVKVKVKHQTSMAFPGTKWETVAPESAGVDSAKLKYAVEYLRKNSGRDGVKELVIIRNGRMIWAGENIDKQHGIWSLTKSFTSTVLGLLIDDGKTTLKTRAKKYIPEMAEAYPKVTLRHFTTMTSGYYAVGDKTRGNYTHGPSNTPFQIGATPLFTPPGTKYAYWDSAMNQFAHVLTKIAEEPIEDLFRRRIADPIGMNRDKWNWGDFGKVDGIVVNGGAGNRGGLVRISARELARFGHLFLNRGTWNGKQLISAEWVDAATRTQVPASTPLADATLSEAPGPGNYGYNWWTNGTDAGGKRKWPAVPNDAYSASGFNNNDMFIIPSWQMVVVRLGLDQRDVKINDEVYATFLNKIGRSIE